jgi:predicted helicase
MYRPFFKQNLYYSRFLNHRVYQQPKIFPQGDSKNLVICTSPSNNGGLSALISDVVPNLHLNGDSQCFPLYYYEKVERSAPSLFDQAGSEEYVRRDGVSDFILNRTQTQYHDKNISKEDIFYYVYGILHSSDYRREFSNDLKKMLPRVPLVASIDDFWSFSKAGRQLAELHINYEDVPEYEGVKVSGTQHNNYHVEKLKFIKKGQKDTILYNSAIKIENIPEKAYEYVVNSKSAIEWIMDRYQITKHKKSGIVNDPNDWANENGNPRYILDLILSVINVSVQTVDIVNNLPKLTFESKVSE